MVSVPSTPITPLYSQSQSRPGSPTGSKPAPLVRSLPPTPISEHPPPIAENGWSLFAPADEGEGDESAEEDGGELPSTEYARLRVKLDALVGVPLVGSSGKGGKGGKGNKKGSKVKPVVGGKPEPMEAVAIRKRMEVVKALYLWNKDDAGGCFFCFFLFFSFLCLEISFLNAWFI